MGQELFFSYARADGEFALKLATDLREAGVDLWMDQLDIEAGERWDRSIERALEEHPALLVILSPESVESTNVMDEVSYALEESKRVVPVLYRPCKVPFRLRRVQHVDFTGDYQAGLDALLDDLGFGRAQPVPDPAPTPDPEPPGPAPGPDPRPSPLKKLLPIAVALLAIVAFFVWRSFQKPRKPPVAGDPTSVAQVDAQEAEDRAVRDTTDAGSGGSSPERAQPVTEGTSQQPADEPGRAEEAGGNPRTTPRLEAAPAESPALRPTVGKLSLPTWVIFDKVYAEEKAARERAAYIKRSGFPETGYLWIPDYVPGGSERFQVYVGPLGDDRQVRFRVCEFNKWLNADSYATRLTKDGRDATVRCEETPVRRRRSN